MNSAVFDRLHTILSTPEDRDTKAERIAHLLREAGGYRWVGLYEVDDHDIAIIAWSGPNAPTYLRFPVTQGLNSEVVRSGETVVVGNVKTDPRYLTTFGTTLSEMILPIKDATTEHVLGTIDVESDQPDAFGEADRLFFEACARRLNNLVEPYSESELL